MQRIKHAPGGLIQAFIVALALSMPCLAQGQGQGQGQGQAQEVEFASSPALREAPREAARPARSPARASSKRAALAPAPSTAPSASATLPLAQETAIAPVLAPESDLPGWRQTCEKILTPFGINTTLIRFGMSGPAVDILGCIILLILGALTLLIGTIAFQAIRYQIADRLQRQQLAQSAQSRQKTEPKMQSGRLKQNTHGSANSRHKPDTRIGGSSRLGIDTQNNPAPPNRVAQNGPNSRLSAETRTGGPASRLGPETRNGPASRLGPETRNGPASRLGPETRNGPASRLGLDTRSAPPTLFGAETPGVNQVIHKNDIQNAPADFDQARFLRKARVYFLRLQLAWDKSDLNSIRQFAAGPVFNEMRKQILERGETINCTDVLAIQTELLGIEIVGGNYIASVKFNGMIKESTESAEAAFEEIWRLSMPTDKQGDWILSGIAQSVLT